MNPRDMTDEQIYALIDQIYKKGAKKHHPDTKQTPEEKERANEEMRELNRIHDEVMRLKKQ